MDDDDATAADDGGDGDENDPLICFKNQYISNGSQEK